MTGLNGQRVYLDWNATAPLRAEARDAMLRAMDEVGNPSSVHAEGRKAKAIVERARAQVADLVGCAPGEVVFTAGATEGLSTVIRGRAWRRVLASQLEHDAVDGALAAIDSEVLRLTPSDRGDIGLDDVGEHVQAVDGLADDVWLLPNSSGPLYGKEEPLLRDHGDLLCVQAANGETGVHHQLDRHLDHASDAVSVLCDLTQVAGKSIASADGRTSIEAPRDPLGELWRERAFTYGVFASHKLGGPKGVGALIVRGDASFDALTRGGGQEMGRRAGTENVIGIAGFGAAAAAAKRDLSDGVWERVAEIRNILESALEDAAPDLLIIGKAAPRLPNTSCFAIPGWRGETQVMAMDLAGFAVSAGSACSSGKVATASRVLTSLGYDEQTAASAIRVSLGPTTTEAEALAFAEAWTSAYARWKRKAA